jgi:hypothetical protein
LFAQGTLIGQGSIRYYYFNIDSTQLCSHVTIELEVLHGFAGIIVATGRQVYFIQKKKPFLERIRITFHILDQKLKHKLLPFYNNIIDA